MHVKSSQHSFLSTWAGVSFQKPTSSLLELWVSLGLVVLYCCKCVEVDGNIRIIKRDDILTLCSSHHKLIKSLVKMHTPDVNVLLQRCYSVVSFCQHTVSDVCVMLSTKHGRGFCVAVALRLMHARRSADSVFLSSSTPSFCALFVCVCGRGGVYCLLGC